MPKNDLLYKLDVARKLGREEATEIETQFMADCAIVTLHRLYGFGPERVKRFIDELSRVHDYFDKTFIVKKDNPECDVRRNELDVVLRECVPPNQFVPFEKRYPTIKAINYGGKT